MKAFGSQIIAEFIDCEPEHLNHAEALEALLKEGILRHELKLKSINSYQFEPIGVTAIAIIGESHVAIHTYPEARHLSLDIFTCSPGSSGPARLMDFLEQALKPEYVRFKELTRGLSVELIQKDYITDFTMSSFDIRYHIQQEILRQRTAYQQMVIIDNKDFGRMLFLDNELQIAEADAHLYNQALVQPIVAAGIPLRKLAVLGGGDGGVLKTLLAAGAGQVYLVDIDAEVVTAAQTHLQAICGQAFADPRTHLQIQEAREFLSTQPQDFDAIVYDLTMSPEAIARHDKDRYFAEFFAQLHSSLKPGGVLTLQVASPSDHQAFERAKALLELHFVDVRFEKIFIPSFCEAWIFAQARKAA